MKGKDWTGAAWLCRRVFNHELNLMNPVLLTLTPNPSPTHRGTGLCYLQPFNLQHFHGFTDLLKKKKRSSSLLNWTSTTATTTCRSPGQKFPILKVREEKSVKKERSRRCSWCQQQGFWWPGARWQVQDTARLSQRKQLLAWTQERICWQPGFSLAPEFVLMGRKL